MIRPSQLTKEAGFDDGVVVEIGWDGLRSELAYWQDAKEWSTEYMESIRPLTGPMAIWNFAPDDAMAVLGHMKDGKIHTLFWAPHMGNTIAIWDGYECFEWARPWWAK